MRYHCVAPVSAVVGDEFMLLDDDNHEGHGKRKKKKARFSEKLSGTFGEYKVPCMTVPTTVHQQGAIGVRRMFRWLRCSQRVRWADINITF